MYDLFSHAFVPNIRPNNPQTSGQMPVLDQQEAITRELYICVQTDSPCGVSLLQIIIIIIWLKIADPKK